MKFYVYGEFFPADKVTGRFLSSPIRVQEEYTGLHTEAALEEKRQEINTSFERDGKRWAWADGYNVVPHLSRLYLTDGVGNVMRWVNGPAFEVIMPEEGSEKE